MRVRKAGKIADNLWYLGREEAGGYFLLGRDGAVMINGALSYLLPDVLAQMDAFGLDPGKIRKYLILHSHFDHVGVVPYFKRNFPEIEVIASAPAWKVFAMPKAIEIMNSYSALTAGRADATRVLETFDLAWRDDIQGSAIGEGDVIDLGDVVLKIIETPGHSNCAIAAYEPNLKALFASDSVGIPFRDALFPSMNTNIAQFLESLEKLKPLPVDYLCADHCGYITGEEAARFIHMTIEESLKWKSRLEDCYLRHGADIESSAKAITDEFFKEMPGYFIAPDILEGVFRQTFKYIGKTLQQAG